MKKKPWLFGIGSLLFAGGAGAVVPLVVAGIVGAVGIAGFSIYRSAVPVDMDSALNFFSSCWSCQIFSDVVLAISNILPPVYKAIGQVCIPIAGALTAVWFAWQVLAGYIDKGKQESAWALSGQFGSHLIKLTFIVALLAWPLPRFITQGFVEPIFNIGMSVSRGLNESFTAGTINENKFDTCLIATAITDPSPSDAGIYSAKLRHELTCQISGVHQMTGFGMATGWTMMNMSFSSDYMHKVLGVPIFPNVIAFLAGLLIIGLFFFALIPVPLYFLEIIIALALDLIMLPLWLLGWLFDGWKILPDGLGNLKKTIERVIKDVCGIAMVLIFVAFAVFLLNAVSGDFGSDSALHAAFATNNPQILMDGLFLENNSLVAIILIGLFMAMFMGMIPKLVNSLFSKVHIPDDFYNKTRDNLKKLWANLKKYGKDGKWKDWLADSFGFGGGGSGGGGGGSGTGAGGGRNNPVLPCAIGVYHTKAFDRTHWKPDTVAFDNYLAGTENNSQISLRNETANHANARRIFYRAMAYDHTNFGTAKNAIENSIGSVRGFHKRRTREIIFTIYSKDAAGNAKTGLDAQDMEILDVVRDANVDFYLVIDGDEQITAAELATLQASAETTIRSTVYSTYAHSTVLTMDTKTGHGVSAVMDKIKV